MSRINRNADGVETLPISDTLALANEQLGIDRACFLIDDYVTEMRQQEAVAALAEVPSRGW
jgi:hypothetical protein